MTVITEGKSPCGTVSCYAEHESYFLAIKWKLMFERVFSSDIKLRVRLK